MTVRGQAFCPGQTCCYGRLGNFILARTQATFLPISIHDTMFIEHGQIGGPYASSTHMEANLTRRTPKANKGW